MVRQALCIGLCALGVSACTNIPLTSIPKLSALKPETMALDHVQLAVRVQEDFRPYRDVAKLRMSVSGPSLELDKSLELQLLPVADDLTPYLQGQERRGYRIAMFSVDPDEVEDINLFRDELLALKAREEGKNALSIGAWAKGCLAQDANPFQTLRMKLYLRAGQDEDFFTLFKEQKLAVSTSEGEGHGISRCTAEDQPNLLWTDAP